MKLPLVLFLILALTITYADTQAFQYDVRGFSISPVSSVAVWNDVKGTNTLVMSRTDWLSPTLSNGAVCFNPNGQVASPFEFANTVTNTITYAVAVVKSDATVDPATGNIRDIATFNYSTLLDTPCATSFTEFQYDSTALCFSEFQIDVETTVNVDTDETPLLWPSSDYKLVEIGFATPQTIRYEKFA